MSLEDQSKQVSAAPARLAVGLCAFQLVYGLIYIWRSSIVVDGKRWFCLFDDAMISMRYARNLVEGHGLVWNPGEFVEGYSNFAWTLLMAACHMLPLEPRLACLPVQILGIITLWAVLFATYRLCRECDVSPIASVLALLLVGLHYNLTYFALLGMETAAVTACITLGMVGCVRMVRTRAGVLTPTIWFAVAIATRNDALFVSLAILGVSFLLVARQRTHVVASALLLIGVFVGHSL